MRAAAVILALLLPVASAAAEPIFRMPDEEIPSMAVKVCFSLNGALEQAKRSQQVARNQTYIGANDSPPPDCAHLNTVIRPLRVETRIAEFVGWAPVYDPRGRHTTTATVNGIRYRIPYEILKRKVRFYEGIIARDDGPHHGWFELSDEPYSILFFREYGLR